MNIFTVGKSTINLQFLRPPDDAACLESIRFQGWDLHWNLAHVHVSAMYMYTYVYIYVIPVVPHKPVAEDSK